ncbi:protein lin-37 homolog [Actinia tenebrosa]|uniref:Protein lin-37 homolog n=1 Tax=Actinia tenebrosa TaxID=6105 RepID=A0A6P8IUU5_ACTTE|nr:protein lin-37 homolog [Actinia tenebrosa]
MATAAGLNSARNKLEGLLNELVEKNDDSIDPGDPMAMIGSSLSSAMPPPSTPTKRSSTAKGPRKRRKKDLGFEVDGSEGSKLNPSYIMKLFDRNVDFAPFGEDTPLYTLAREWMENKPHRMKLASDSQDLPEGEQLSSSQGSSSSVLSNDPSTDSKAVYCLPLPKFKREKKDHTPIPKPLPHPPLSLNIHYNVDSGPNINDLKRNHIQRWKKVKSSWKEASLANQAHYTPSIKKIRQLFESYK